MKAIKTLFASTLALSCLTACIGNSSEEQIAQQPTIAQKYQGIWLAPGYGEVISISDRALQRYRYTSDYCVLEEAFEGVTSADLNRNIQVDSSGETLQWFAQNGTQSFSAPSPNFYRQASLPVSCQGQVLSVDDTLAPIEMFDLFSQIMEEYYVDFSAQNVDWAALSYTQRLTVTNSEDSLYEAIYQSFLALSDGHNSWTADNGLLINVLAKPTHQAKLIEEFADAQGLSYPLQEDEISEQLIAQLNAYIEAELEQEQAIIMSYASSDIEQDASEQISWFEIGSTGYLRIDAMTNFSSAAMVSDDLTHNQSTLENLNSALDSALTDLQDTQSLIIDLRGNGGGQDFVSLAIASRFTDASYLGYQKYARDGSGVTETVEVTVSPSDSLRYTNRPVVVLTSADTASAAEVFTLMMAELDNVSLVGEVTQGIFSDVMQWQLPGGHILGLSNEVYLNADGETFEGSGIPVDQTVPYFTKQSRLSGVDEGLEAALALLP